MTWNVRGINSSWKWDSVKNKIVEAQCDIVCLQETKKDQFDRLFLKKICPPAFDCFDYLPSVGASGGILIAWKGSLFSAVRVSHNNFALTMEFCSIHNASKWVLTCVYAPCTPEGRSSFLDWLQNVHMDPGTDWIILGDFNLIRKLEDRNKPGGDLNDIFRFNAAISLLGVNEIVLQGRKYTWSNMQPSPLLEKIDWVFTSNSWTLSYPSTTVTALDMNPSDHCPCVVQISTHIPKNTVFRFENHWLKHQDYQNVLSHSWAITHSEPDSAKLLTAKLKTLRKCLKDWQASMQTLKVTIANVRIIMLFLEVLSDYRDLSLAEWNFHKLLQAHLLDLLEKQRIYWKQRGNVKWVQLGDAGTNFFHANATIRSRGNLITSLISQNGTSLTNHKDKEALLWQEFKERLGITEFNGFTINPMAMIQRSDNLSFLEDPFTIQEIETIIKHLPNYKSPGPDGFNNEFIKASWPVIKQQYLDLCFGFFENNCCL